MFEKKYIFEKRKCSCNKFYNMMKKVPLYLLTILNPTYALKLKIFL